MPMNIVTVDLTKASPPTYIWLYVRIQLRNEVEKSYGVENDTCPEW